MILYADVLFAINFSMDFLALFITIKIMHKRLYKLRILISALIGSAYSVIEMITKVKSPMLEIGINIFVALIMCIICFKETKISRFIISYAMFWGVSALMGGFMSLIFSIFNKIFYTYIVNSKLIATNAYNGVRFIVVALISILASFIVTRIYNSKKAIKNVQIEIEFENNSYSLNGLCDSGNLLTEPLSGKSVILVSQSSMLGGEIKNHPDYKKRYIPYTSVNAKGILKGIIPKKIIINDSEVDAIVATSEENDFGGYEALVPISLI